MPRGTVPERTLVVEFDLGDADLVVERWSDGTHVVSVNGEHVDLPRDKALELAAILLESAKET